MAVTKKIEIDGKSVGFRPVLKQKSDDRAYIVNEISTIVW